MLTEEKKQNILKSLEQDYVPFSDVFHEICADTLADMVMTGSLNSELGKADRLQLHQLEQDYFKLVSHNYRAVLPLVEKVLFLQNKYQQLRAVC